MLELGTLSYTRALDAVVRRRDHGLPTAVLATIAIAELGIRLLARDPSSILETIQVSVAARASNYRIEAVPLNHA